MFYVPISICMIAQSEIKLLLLNDTSVLLILNVCFSLYMSKRKCIHLEIELLTGIITVKP